MSADVSTENWLSRSVADTGEIENEVKAHRLFIVLLMEEIKKVTARAEAYRCLLISKGTFSNAEFEQAYTDALTEWDRQLHQALRDGQKGAIDGGFRRLLEKHEGTKQ